MKEKRRFSLKAVIIFAIAAFLLGVGAVVLTAWLLLGRGGFALVQAAVYIDNRFVAEYDREDMVDSALAGMVDSLGDRWSYYLNARQRIEIENRRENQYVGAGFTFMTTQEGYMELVAVAQDGPAERAGLVVGDVIVAIQGERLNRENLESLRGYFQAETGTQVELTAQNAQGAERTLTLTLALVETDPVTSQMLEGQLGYVRLENFYHKSAQRIREATDELVAQGAKGIIFDVRGNPGGFVSELTEILDYLLPEGAIFTEMSRGGRTTVIESDESCIDLPMVVLVDANSYSAAELFAAQLRENVGAALVGQVTSGKGYYQVTLPLFNGGALGISVGKYGTGAGESLIGTGLTPDILEDDWDRQTDRAVARLQEEIDRAAGREKD